MAYFATGLVADIAPDPLSEKHRYAEISEYLPFDAPVPWLQSGRYAEEALRDLENVAQLGLYLRGRSVRPLGDDDYFAIVERGLLTTLHEPSDGDKTTSAAELDIIVGQLDQMAKGQRERAILSRLVNRKVRDRNFRRAVCMAYEGRCAVTGISLRDAAGRFEVQGAHIRAVADDGPDVVTNGIALSGTIHWLFDRHMISLDDDLRVLVTTRGLPQEIMGLLPAPGCPIRLPANINHRPSASYVAWHRNKFLKPQE